MGIHEHPQPDRLRSARQTGVESPRPTSAPLAVLAVIFGALAAVVMVAVMLGIVVGAMVTRPGFWLGVVVVAVLLRLAGWW